jgi:23S rRNA U2552 (ribose-2'-O)-methylase RlmE/FtsJ
MQRHLRDEFVKKAQQDGYASRAAYKLKEICDKHHGLVTGTTFVCDVGAAPGSWTQVACALTKSTAQRVRVVSIDLLPMAPVPGSRFVLGDFTQPASQEAMISHLLRAQEEEEEEQKAEEEEIATAAAAPAPAAAPPPATGSSDGFAGGLPRRATKRRRRRLDQLCVLSDIRANTSGNHALDHARQVELCDSVLRFAAAAAGALEHRLGRAPKLALVAKMTMGEDLAEFRGRVSQLFPAQNVLVKPKSSRASSPEIYVVATTHA